jgi:Zn-dependent protease
MFRGMFIEQLFTDPRYYFAVVIAVVVSICLHELAHGLAAVRKGDDTPIEQGRITLNPLVHMGPVSIVIMLLAGIAWGSMPIDRTRMRGRFAEAFVAFAGPLTNGLIAVVTLTAFGLWRRYDPRTPLELGDFAANGQLLLVAFGSTNVLLMLFNLLPVPPLDGSHILANFSKGYAKLMETLSLGGGSFAMLAIVFLLAGRFISPLAARITWAYLDLVRGN